MGTPVALLWDYIQHKRAPVVGLACSASANRRS